MIVFRSERLVARLWTPEDAEAAFAIYSDPEVTRYIGDGTPRGSLEEQRAGLARSIGACAALGGRMGTFALVDESGLVGTVALKPLPESEEIEVGWHLARRVWGRGYATEAARAALEHARDLGVSRVLAVVQPPNRASCRVAERLGMRYQGRTGRFYGRELELYAIDLAPGPATPRPHLRQARSDDAPVIGALQVRAWRWAYAGLLPEAMLAGLSAERRAGWWRQLPDDQRVWLAEDAGVTSAGLMGFCATAPARDAGTGEVRAIYIEEAALGKGVGRALMRRALTDLDSRGFRRATLWVLESNARGRRFYEAGGWRADGETRVEVWDGVGLHEVRYAIELPLKR